MHVVARLGLVAACFVGALVAGALVPRPASLHELAREMDPGRFADEGPSDPNATLAWDGRAFAVAFLWSIEYNATRDATLAGARVCSHDPCWPLVWVRGRLDGSPGPFLLVPTSDVLTLESTHALRESRTDGPVAPTTYAQDSPYDRVAYAIAEPFVVEDARLPSYASAALVVAPLALAALVPAGLRGWQRALLVVPVAAAIPLALHAVALGLGALVYTMTFGLLWLGSLGLLLLLSLAGRVHAGPLAGFLLASAFFFALGLVSDFHPSAGWGD